MSYIGSFDVLGPNMIGPSSSHTAGAVVIAYLAQKMMAGTVAEVEFTLYGSFANTYKGHGTDRALLGGIMGFEPCDSRIRDSYEIANKQGLLYHFIIDGDMDVSHPNSVDIKMTNTRGQIMQVRGESVGGGKARISQINGVEVEFTGEYASLIVIQEDNPGVAAHITRVLSDNNINIAYMKLFREEKGSTAYTIVEADVKLPAEIVAKIYENSNVQEVMLVQ